MRKLREAMAEVHPELENQLKMHGELNGSYEAAAEYIERYNRLHHKVGETYTIIYSDLEAENGAVRDLGNTFNEAGVAIEKVDTSVHDITNEVKDSTGVTLEVVDAMSDVKEGVENTASAVTELHPAIDDAVTDFEVLSESVEDAGDDVSEGFMSGIINGIGQAWKNFWEDEIFWFKELFGIHSPSTLFNEFGVNIIQGLLNGIDSLKDRVYELWQNIKEGVVQKVWDMRDGVIGWVQNIKRGVESQFTAIKEKSISIWNSIKDGLKTPLNAILSGVETMVNGFIKGINKMIESVNNLGSIKVPDWAKSKLGIGDFSINIPTIKEISLPRLAQGAVIPPNREFMAVLGDQSSGTNIEAPLETIKEALAEVMGNQTQAVGSAVMQLDGQTFARLVTPYVVSELGRRGYDVKVIGA